MLKFERDAIGRITKEWQNDHWIENTYDELGIRTHVESSLGAKIAMELNQMGQVTHLAGAQAGNAAWVAQMSYNVLGQEELRKVSGGVISEWQFDPMGRATGHKVNSHSRTTRKRKYDWDVNQRLRSITDELNNKRTSFSYDEFSNLIKADYGFSDILHRESDDVGNLYEKADKSDRIYGKGSRLEQSSVNTNELKNKYQGGHGKLVTKGAQYQYDGEGNLIKKIEAPDPDAWVYGKKGERVYSPSPVWEYEYYGNGMLKKVIKPDGEEISFRYDSLGRRVEKSSNSKIVKFVWDGNNPLHEWEENVEKPRFNRDSLVTWIFKDNFVPSAKLTNQGHNLLQRTENGTNVTSFTYDFGVLSANGDPYLLDDLGSPVRFGEEIFAYDEFGNNMHEDTSSQTFGFTGYQHDGISDTLLSPTRAYDPKIGRFTSEDIIKGFIEVPFTLNQYTYCRNQPMDLVDLDGKFFRRIEGWFRGLWDSIDGDRRWSDIVQGLWIVTEVDRSDLLHGGWTLANQARNEAVIMANDGYGGVTGGNRPDAFRHFSWNFNMTRDISIETAIFIGSIHEVQGLNRINAPGVLLDLDHRRGNATGHFDFDTIKDIWNNAVGQQMGYRAYFGHLSHEEAFAYAEYRGWLILNNDDVLSSSWLD